MYGQLIKSLDHVKILEISRKNGGEKYVKSFDGYTHLLTMLFAVIMRFDSLREIEAAMTAEARKLHHIGYAQPLVIKRLSMGRSCLADSNNSFYSVKAMLLRCKTYAFTILKKSYC